MGMSEKWKKIFAVLLIITAAIVFLRWIYSKSDLGEFKQTTEVKLDSSAEVIIEQLLGYIEKNNMNAVFQLMFSSDYGNFQENYVNKIFATPDFLPVEFTGKVRKIQKSSSENILVEVYSQKRDKNYWISLVKYNGVWKIAGIGSFQLPDVK